MEDKISPTDVKDSIRRIDFYIEPQRLKAFLSTHPEAEKYQISEIHRQSPHRFGDGGEYEHVVTLLNSGIPVALFRDYEEYDTYADDSEDYNVRSVRTGFLLSDDCLAKIIFESLPALGAA